MIRGILWYRQCCLNLPLGVVLRLELQQISTAAVEEPVDDLISLPTKRLLHVLPADPGSQQAVHVAHASILQLVLANRNSGSEKSHQSLDLCIWDGPHTEEANDMVDAEGMEVLGHVLHAVPPPRVAVSSHMLPVVRRQLPVLAPEATGVWRRTSLGVEEEVLRVDPSVHRVFVDTNGEVALQANLAGLGVLRGLEQLLVEMVLGEVVGLDFFLREGLGQFDGLFWVHGGILSPLGKVGGATLITEYAEGSIRYEPCEVLGHKGSIGGIRLEKALCLVLCVCRPYQAHFGVVCFCILELGLFQSFLLLFDLFKQRLR
mmetsp:Transcript_17129/g.28170  ORF Transcript_17129/g.28170 Transcript_17129/m.28170 type:complete len:317 (+) Transcript_17129:1725-2675(+)